MTVTTDRPRVTGTPPAGSPAAARHFASRLQFETDASDVWADLENGTAEFVLVDTRNRASYDGGHLPGALSLPHREIADRAHELPADRLVVVYCDGPACNAATRGAAALASLGYRVKEMLGGVEGWQREGYPLVT
jgi:rhodanese-related sulfurtransferase